MGDYLLVSGAQEIFYGGIIYKRLLSLDWGQGWSHLSILCQMMFFNESKAKTFQNRKVNGLPRNTFIFLLLLSLRCMRLFFNKKKPCKKNQKP